MNKDVLLMELLQEWNCNDPIATKKVLLDMLLTLDNIVNDSDEYSQETKDLFNDLESEKEIVIFYDCDEYNSRDSMRFICCCDIEKEDETYRAIQQDRNYTDEEMEKYIYCETTILNDMNF